MKDGSETEWKVELPEPIKMAINTDKLVVFVGAGLSRLLGLPSWEDLSKKMVNWAISDGKLSFIAGSHINAINNPKKVLSMVYESYSGDYKVFNNHYCKELNFEKIDEDNIGVKIIRVLLDWNAHIITTNYDLAIEKIGDYRFNIINSCDDFKEPEKHDAPALLHLHGSVSSPDSMVFTARQYYELYGKNGNIEKVLKYFFNGTYTILFIGYGLEEPEIQYYLQKCDSKDCFFTLIPSYILLPDLQKYEMDYYKSINVQAIPYHIDEKGYEAIWDVISDWKEYIDSKTKLYLIKNSKIKSIIEGKIDGTDVSSLKSLLSNNEQKYYLLKLLNKSDQKDEWTPLLFDSELFDASRMIEDVNKGELWPSFAIHLLSDLVSKEHSEILLDKCRQILDVEIDVQIMDLNTNAAYQFLSSVELLIVNSSYINEKTLDFISELIENKGSAYLSFISSVDISKFNCLVLDYKIKLLNVMIQGIIRNRGVRTNYIFTQLYDNVICELSSVDLSNLSNIIIKCVVEYVGDNRWCYSEVGSIKNYCLNNDKNVDSLLILIFDKVLKSGCTNDFKSFSAANLTSNNHILNTLALHVINVHFDELKTHILEMDNYNCLNYSEFYDLLKNNLQYLSSAEVELLVDSIQNYVIHKDHNPNYSRLCRYDLLSLIRESYSFVENQSIQNKLEMLLKENYSEKDNYPAIEDRGKLIITTVSWGNEVGPQFTFDNLDDLISKSFMADDEILERDANNYLLNHKEEVFDNLDKCLNLDARYLGTIFDILSDSGLDNNLIFNFYSKSLSKVSFDKLLLLKFVQNYSRWSTINKIQTDDAFDLLLDMANRYLDYYLIDNVEDYSDLGYNIYFNWYSSILSAILSYPQSEEFAKSHSSSIISLFDKCLKNDSSNIGIIKNIIALNWRRFYFMNDEWSETNIDSIYGPDLIDNVVMFLHSSSLDVKVYDCVNEWGGFKIVLDNVALPKVFNNDDSCEFLGAYSSCLHLLKLADCTELFQYGLGKSEASPYLFGIVSQLNKSSFDDNMEEDLLKLILKFLKTDIISIRVQHSLSDYVRKSKSNMDLKVKFMVKITEFGMEYVDDNFLVQAIELIEDYPSEMYDLAVNLSKKELSYYPEEYRKLVTSLPRLPEYEDKLVEICVNTNKKTSDDFLSLDG